VELDLVLITERIERAGGQITEENVYAARIRRSMGIVTVSA
jgi:hypothetical protein